MGNTLVFCGGTGAHTSVAFLRLHTLGYALGFFDFGETHFEFPTIFLIDQDTGGAWQLARDLVDAHPARRDWTCTQRLEFDPFSGRNGVLVEMTRQAMIQVEGAHYSVPSRWKGLRATAYGGVSDLRMECCAERVTLGKQAAGQPHGARPSWRGSRRRCGRSRRSCSPSSARPSTSCGGPWSSAPGS